MGYLTNFSLEMKKDSRTKESFFEILKTFSEMKGFSYIYKCNKEEIKKAYQDEDFYELYIGEWKWYECETELEKIGRKFPNVLFKLKGEGENREDVWELRILGEKKERKEMILVLPEEQFTELIF